MDSILEMFTLMGLGSWIVIGLLAGVTAKFLLPGKDPGGCVMTVAIGIVGALLGGFLATYLGFGGLSGFDLRSFVIATLGAFVLLLLLRVLKSDKSEAD
jgi:uncharacterized membrane protein YeaQ/YmgE (transglycosylase-associated protein family)